MQACAESNLEPRWDDGQISSFLDLLHKQYYSVLTLDSYWNAFIKIGHILGKKLTEKQKNDFDLVREVAKELKDN